MKEWGGEGGRGGDVRGDRMLEFLMTRLTVGRNTHSNIHYGSQLVVFIITCAARPAHQLAQAEQPTSNKDLQVKQRSPAHAQPHEILKFDT